MKKHLFGLSVICLQFTAFSQTFQQIYGNTDNQQDNYAVEQIDSDYFLGGTYRNYTTFPNLNFYGTLSRFEPDGTRLWSKVYIPQGFQPMAAYFIRSVVNKGDTAMICLGEYLSSSNNPSGYCIFETNLDGVVSWAKQYAPQAIPNEFCKIIPGDNCLYVMTSLDITRMDLNGNVLNSIAFQNDVNDLKDIYVTTDGSLIVTGECSLNNQFSSLVLQLASDLDYIAGFRYSAQNGGGFTAHEVSELSNGRILMTGERFLLAVLETGAIDWAKQILPSGNIADSLYDSGQNISLQAVTANHDNFLLMNGSLFTDNFGNFQYYITNFRLDDAGTVSEVRQTKTTNIDASDNLRVDGMYLDTVTGTYIMVGNYTNINDWHLNYIQRCELEQPGCGEEPTTLNVSDYSNSIIVQLFPAQQIIDTTLEFSDITFFSADLPVAYTNDFCTQLSNNEPSSTSFLVYPNPTNSELHFTSNTAIDQVRMLDVAGRLVSGYTFNGISITGLEVLQCGTYFVEITSGNTISVIPFKKL